MKKIIISFFVFVSLVMKSQNVGIGIQNPTRALDVNGEVRVRNCFASTDSKKILTIRNQNTTVKNILTSTSAFNMLYSTGIYNRQVSNNNWRNIVVGKKLARLDFSGRTSVSAADFTFSLLYDVENSAIKVLKQPVFIGSTSYEITNISGHVFTIQAVSSGGGKTNFVCTISFNTTHPVGTASITVPGGSWIQGTIRSIPVL